MSRDDEHIARPGSVRIPDSGDEILLGQWFWVNGKSVDGDDKWLGCVTSIGSNYAGLTSPARYSGEARILFSDFGDFCVFEERPEVYIKGQIAAHQENVRLLMDEIKLLTAVLGIAQPGTLAEGQSQALAAVSGAANIHAHKQALINAKQKTLPDLFQKIEAEHEQIACWMKAELLPMKAQLKVIKDSTLGIEDRIFSVELYAGLVENVSKIRDGKPAGHETKVSIYQRRHYMDEECLAAYEAGGMDYSNISDFNKWLTRDDNLNRILPHPRCIVAFRVRRDHKNRDGVDLGDFIRIALEESADQQTFLYIRNGEQVFSLQTGIDFGEQLFPDQGQNALLGSDVIYMRDRRARSADDIITQARYEELEADWQARIDKFNETKMKAEADAANGVSDRELFRKYGHYTWSPTRTSFDQYVPCEPGHKYYDDGMRQISKATRDHNRVAVVLQGLLDRSPALHPHPQWKLWTQAGFNAGVELIYDQTRVISSGDAPDFEIYREQLNKSIKVGSITIGQQDFFARTEAVKENKRRDNDWRRPRRDRDADLTHFVPDGNPGPGTISTVARFNRSGKCVFEWDRERLRKVSWRFRSPNSKTLQSEIAVESKHLLNISAYNKGDYKIFFNDPRTRADYLKWAPFLLAAEDYLAKKDNLKERDRLKRQAYWDEQNSRNDSEDE